VDKWTALGTDADVTKAAGINRSFWRYAFESAKGGALFWLSYLALGVLGTRVFARDASSVLVLAVFFACVIAIGMALWRIRLIGRLTLVFYGLSFPVAAGLFLIPINNNIPADARAFNEGLSAQHEERLGYAKALFDILAARWSAPLRQYLLEPHKVFLIKDFRYFWAAEGGYVDSNSQAQMYRRLLIASGRFSAEEAELALLGCGLSPHAFVALNVGDTPVYADLWAADNVPGYQFGMYAAAPCDQLRGEPFLP